MHIAIGADHAGFSLKQDLLSYLGGLDHEVNDLGTYTTDPVDYHDYADEVGSAILKNSAQRGILICGSGVGAAVAVNKLPGIRGGLCHDTYSAHQGVEHDDMNVLVLGARVIGPSLARELVHAFLNATFSGEERHRRRLEKVRILENRFPSRLLLIRLFQVTTSCSVEACLVHPSRRLSASFSSSLPTRRPASST
jgi:RpiB/LacA/LacB family sugar-phosphate isomerase